MHLRPSILLFLKAPVPGMVKTRLAANIGADAACRIYRKMVDEQLCRLPPEWRVEIHFSPAAAEADMRSWLGDGLFYHPQVDGDLGHRLQNGFTSAFSRGADLVCAIGGDCPALRNKHFNATHALLQAYPESVVIGPSSDGGYYLIASRRDITSLFQDIPWSTGKTLCVTLERARAAYIGVHLLEQLCDVDTVTDLENYGWRVPSTVSP